MQDRKKSAEKKNSIDKGTPRHLIGLFREWRVLMLMPLSFTTFLAYTTVLPDANPWIGLSFFLATFYISAATMLRLSVRDTLGILFKALLEFGQYID